LEEARKKSKIAVYMTDLSTNEDTPNDGHYSKSNKVKKQFLSNKTKVDCPPSLKRVGEYLNFDCLSILI